MRKNFERDGREIALFRDFYELLQKYWIVEESDEYWCAFAEDFANFERSYPDIKLARYLINAFRAYLEEVYKYGRSV